MVLLRRLATAISLLGAVILAGCAGDGSDVQSQKMAAIKARGSLLCGTDGKLPGFSYVGSDGRYAGLDVDTCRAVAAAMLGDGEKVQFRDLNPSERFAALSSGEVDLLARNTTMTLSRDAAGGNGLSFAPTTFYDGQGVMAPSASGIRELKDLAGKPVCVPSGTTSELNLADRMREKSIAFTPLKFQTLDQMWTAYFSGRCAAVSTDRSQMAAYRSILPQPALHTLLPVVMSKEPLTVSTINADPAWADAVRWIINGLIQAEELGITKANLEAKLSAAKADPSQAELRRFLGVEGEFGRQLALPADFVVQAVRAVGNYGEIFERNLGQSSKLKLDRGVNRLWTQGGLIYSPPFR